MAAKSLQQRPNAVFDVARYNDAANTITANAPSTAPINAVITDAMMRTMICAAANRGRNAVR